ncbi:MAG: hypothetical protein HKN09_07925, partial [Saprospiraceae bacterium]|nr:hypothetical protein [Saprospiraceae bacterium]
SDKNCTEEQIPLLESQIKTNYNKSPDLALIQMQELIQLYQCSDAEHHKLGNTYLNMGTLYNEEKNKLDSAIIFLSKADAVFQKAKDTLGWANILKYQGLVEVRAGDPQGLSKIQFGKDLYEAVNFQKGRMVAQQNEATAYFHLEDYRKADSLLTPCLDFWNGEHIRWQYVFYDLMQLYEKSGDCTAFSKAKPQVMSYTDMLSVENMDRLEKLEISICQYKD